MGCTGSKAAWSATASNTLKTKSRSNSKASLDSLDKTKNDRSYSIGSQSNSDNSGELSDEEIDQMEREQRELIWAQKDDLRDRIRMENMMDGECIQATTDEKSALDLLKQEEEMAVLNSDAARKQKQARRRKLKRKAEKEQKWMVFGNSDCFDETDMKKLAEFLSIVMKVIPALAAANNNNNVNRADSNGSDCRGSIRTGNVIADYLASKDEKSQSQENVLLKNILVDRNNSSQSAAIKSLETEENNAPSSSSSSSVITGNFHPYTLHNTTFLFFSSHLQSLVWDEICIPS